MVKGRFKWLFDLTKTGVRPNSDADLARRIVFSNIVFISLPAVYFIFMVIDYKTYLLPVRDLRFDQFIVPIVILICVLCIWLNKKNKTGASRTLFLASWPLLLHVIPIQLLRSPSDYFFAFPIGLVFHSILIQLMLSYSKQPVQFWCWIGINFITLLFVPEILMYFNSLQTIPTEMISGRYYRLDFILYWLLFNLVVFYTIVELEKYIQNVRGSRALIESQRDKLTALNQNLEEIVLQRTLTLEEQNQKLRSYAFYNAHSLRGPFCRIKGLIQLQELRDNSAADNLEIDLLLKHCLEELDTKIHEIQFIVQSEEFDREQG